MMSPPTPWPTSTPPVCTYIWNCCLCATEFDISRKISYSSRTHLREANSWASQIACNSFQIAWSEAPQTSASQHARSAMSASYPTDAACIASRCFLDGCSRLPTAPLICHPDGRPISAAWLRASSNRPGDLCPRTHPTLEASTRRALAQIEQQPPLCPGFPYLNMDREFWIREGV